MKMAEYWHRLDADRLQCDLCPHECKLCNGETGLCRVRGAREGEMKALCYGMISSAHIDPIEKKPLYHFYPGSTIFSIGGWGCNLSCAFCQNWTISQEAMLNSRRYSAEEIVQQVSTSQSIGIAYTYNEPLIAFEFVRDCARLTRDKGLANVLVTNGYIKREPAGKLLAVIDALNIDVKSMDEGFYASHCRGRLAPVLAFAKQARDVGCHVEITNLVIPGLNDEESQFQTLASWVSGNLGRATPLHLSAYRPQYRMDISATSLSSLERGFAVCSEELDYVYLGNIVSEHGQDTRCPDCQTILISRHGYAVVMRDIVKTACGKCGRKLNIRFG